MKKTLKKLFAVVFIAGIIMSAFTGCTPRAKQLKIYNWGDYMDQSVIDGFAEWYKNETNEKVKVVYKSFDTNETMYESVEAKGKDWDLVCPSDYMIEKMIDEGLAQKIDKNIIDINDGRVDESLMNIISTLSSKVDATEYTIPYVWGTFGIMYDHRNVTKEEASTWESLWSDKFKGNIWMKDSIRDAYAVASLYANRDKLREYSDDFTKYGNENYQDLIASIFTDYTTESIAKAKTALLDQKPNLKDYEVDKGKTEMYSGNGKLGLFWSCDAGFVMNDIEIEAKGCSKGGITKGNKNLFYEVPKEGSNMWIDGWLITKNAKNSKAANYFLKYLMETENSITNAMYAGAPTPNSEAMKDYRDILEADEDGFFDDAPAGFKEMYMEMMFPSDEVLKRCGVMSNLGDAETAVKDMWRSVRSSK